MDNNFGTLIEGIRILLEVLLVPIVSKVWAMDMRLSKIEAMVDRRDKPRE